MILASLTALTWLSLSQDRSAIKEVLPNGSTLYVQKMDGAKTFSVVLASVPPGEPETVETHGARHLLEHLAAKGLKKDVDLLVEGSGMVLLAETNRDAVTFQINGPSESLTTGLTAVRKILEGFEPSAEEIKREVSIVSQELALRKWDLQASGDGWIKVYGDRAIDPFGDPSVMAGMTPEALKAAYKRMTAGKSVCICVIGPMEAEATARQVRSILTQLAPGPDEEPWARPQATSGAVSGVTDGVAVCTPISLLTDRQSLITVGAGFGLRAWTPGCSMLMTPSPRNGMMSLALRSGTSWSSIAKRLAGREVLVAQTGQNMLRTWLKETAESPSKLAKLAAVMLPVRPGFDPPSIGSLANDITMAEITDQVRRILSLASPGGLP